MITINLTLTFGILFEIEIIGATTTGLLMSWGTILIIILDYPSGALGDYIGHRWVLFTAYAFWTASSVLLFFARSPLDFFMIHTITAIAGSQESGALFSWLDNNYQQVARRDDPDRTIYGHFISRVDTLVVLVSIPSMILGGLISFSFERRLAFAVQAAFTGLFCLTIPSLLRDVKDSELPTRSKQDESTSTEKQSYFHILKQGITFVLSTKQVLLIFMGLILFGITRRVYIQLLRPVIFFEYSGNDLILSTTRAIYFVLGTALSYHVATVSKKIKPKKIITHWALLSTLSAFILFGGMALITIIFPPKTEFNAIALALLVSIVVTTIFINGLIFTIQRRVLSQLIPNSIRNSTYSLLPTLVSLLSLVTYPIAGYWVDTGQFVTLFLVLISGTILGSVLLYLSDATKSLPPPRENQ